MGRLETKIKQIDAALAHFGESTKKQKQETEDVKKRVAAVEKSAGAGRGASQGLAGRSQPNSTKPKPGSAAPTPTTGTGSRSKAGTIAELAKALGVKVPPAAKAAAAALPVGPVNQNQNDRPNEAGSVMDRVKGAARDFVARGARKLLTRLGGAVGGKLGAAARAIGGATETPEPPPGAASEGGAGLGKIGSAARGLGYVTAAAGITNGILKFTEGGGAARREQLEDQAFTERDSRVSTLKRGIARKRTAMGASALELSTMDVRDSAAVLWGRAKSAAGFDDAKLASMETQDAIRDAGINANADSLMAEARRRRSSPLGRMVDAITPDFLKRGKAEDAKGAAEMAKRGAALKREGYAAIERNDFSAAEVAFKASAAAVGEEPATWKTPRQIWFAMDSAKGADRMYYASQNPTPQLRIGE